MNTTNDLKIAIFDKENTVKALNADIRDLYQKLSDTIREDNKKPASAKPE